MWATIGATLKKLLGFIGKQLARWVFIQLVLWLSGVGLAWMILTLQEDIAKAFKEYNAKIMAKIYKIEDFVFNLNHKIQVFFDELLEGIESRIVGGMESILPSQVDAILKTIGMAAWIDAFFSEIADAAGNAVRDTVATVTEPMAASVRAARWRLESIRDALQSVAAGIQSAEDAANAEIDALFARLQAMVDGFNAQIDEIQGRIRAVEDRVNAEVRGLYDSIAGAVRSQVDAINGRVDALFARLQDMVDRFNAQIDEIQGRIQAAEDRVNEEVRGVYDGVTGAIRSQEDAYNSRVDALFGDVQGMIDRFNTEVLEIKSRVEAGLEVDWSAYTHDLEDFGINRSAFLLELDLPAFSWTFTTGIDFSVYRTSLSDFGLDREDYRVEIEVPALEWTFDAGIDFQAYKVALSDYGIRREDYRVEIEVPALDNALLDIRLTIEDVCDVETGLELLPQDVREAFMAHYPAFLITNFEERLKQFFIVALTAALVQQIDKVRTAFTEARGRVESYFVEAKEAVIAQTEAIADDIFEAEMAFVNALPDILEPALKKQVERIKEKVVEAQDEILANIDDLYIDTALVDHVLQSVGKRPAGDAPIKFDSAPWTLDDIYRMLCNYYWKHERMALAMIIATQDMGIDSDDLRDLMLGLGAPGD